MSSLTPRLDRSENAIVNAPMEFWQRVGGATTTINSATPTSGYTADRMQYGTTGTTVKNLSIVRDGADAPAFLGTGNNPVAYSYKFSCLTAIASPAAGDVVNPWQYRVEGYDYAKFHANAATFSFWIKVTSPASFPIAVPVAFSNNSTRSYLTTVSVTANSTWQQCVVNLTMDNASGWAFDNTNGLKITIASSSGSNFQGIANTWQAGDLFTVAGAFNSMSSNTNVIRIAAPQLILGTLDTPKFGRAGKNVGHELLLCQRYYEKSYDVDVAPDTLVIAGCEQYLTLGSNAEQHSWGFRVNKRATPVVAFKDPVSGTAGQVDRARNVTDGVQVFLSLENTGQRGFGSQTPVAVGKLIRFQWTADSEL